MHQLELSVPGTANFLSGGGEMGQRIREYDWSSTPLGPIETWPQGLRTCVRIMLSSRQPIWIGWGKDLIKLYNDPYKAIVGGKHPWALGKPASVVWKDIWRDIEPMLRQVMEKDTGTYVESQLLIMERNGFAEETYYTFSYTPIPGDNGGTAGMICFNTDDTDRIISERQLKTLTVLGKNLADSASENMVIEEVIQSLGENPYDFPFLMFYSVKEHVASLARSTNPSDVLLWPRSISRDDESELARLFKAATDTRRLQVLENLESKLESIPKGGWEIAPEKAIILPVMQASAKEPFGFLVFGFNPYRLLDEKYISFFNLIADQIATSIADVYVLAEERRRAAALAEIDRAKTTFFSNISHEFRTPLTLMLGPIEDALKDPETALENKIRMDVAYRNGRRLQKLVNTLLEFSKIEAGRVEGRFVPVDIAAFTSDLASTFRSAIERAGMELVFRSSPVTEKVFVDVDMWEKIILNLISNAFKYSKEGRITVEVKQEGPTVQVLVEDTGVGIPEDQIEKIFDRFHRIENIQGRSQEGTGIGLAMVKELVRIHQGQITVKSSPGKGSVFTVSLPVGPDHLPAGQVVNDDIQQSLVPTTQSILEEALNWIENDAGKAGFHAADVDNIGLGPKTEKKFRVLLADDNADMRDYVSRLLGRAYHVTKVSNGRIALETAIATLPDLVLSDVMMPEMDGLTLVQRLKEDSRTKAIPVMLLSARAGEEDTIEGLSTGADDYLVKPFSARELLIRVESNIRISKTRQAAEENIRNVFMQAPVAACILAGADHTVELANAAALELWGRQYDEVINKPTAVVFPELIEQGFIDLLDRVYLKGERFVANEMPVALRRNGKEHVVYINFIYDPLRDSNGDITGVIAIGTDVTAQVEAKRIIEESERKFRNLIAESPSAIAILKGEEMIISVANSAIIETWGKGSDVIGKSLFEVMPEIIDQGFKDLFDNVYRTGKPFYGHETPVLLVRNGKEELVYYNFVYQAHHDAFGAIEGVAIIATEVTPYAIVKKQLSESEERLRVAIESAEMGTWDYNPATGVIICSDRTREILGLPADVSITLPMVLDLIAEKDRSRVSNAIQNSMDPATGGHYDLEYELTNRATGHLRIVRAKGTVHFSVDHQALRLAGIILDVTEQRRSEEVVRAKTKELEFVTNVMPQMIWATNADGYADFYNERWYQYTGLNFEQVKGTGWLQSVHPEDYEKTVDAWKVAVGSGKEYQVEYRLRRFDGAYRWFLARGVAMKNEAGQIVKWYGSTTDIDEQKRAAEILEAKVEERTKDLVSTNRQLERSNHELEQFAFVTSHDLQEPLRKIQTFSNMLVEKNEGALNESSLNFIEKITGASRRMSQLINDLLNFSRLSSREVAFEKVDLNEVLNNIRNDFEVIIARKNAVITAASLPVIEAVPLQMNQLFYNLMGNALKFTSEDKAPVIDISCSHATREDLLEESLPADITYYRLEFHDNGIGFNQQYAQKIFEIFQRLHGRSQYEGTGIGLALASKIILNHKGSIRAFSEEGKGARFVMFLPEQQPA